MQYTSHRRPRRSHRQFPFKILLLLFLILILITVIISCSRSDQTDVPSNSAVSSAPSESSSPLPSESFEMPLESQSPEPSDEVSSSSPSQSVGNTDVSESEIPWYLVLANASHPLPEDFQFETATLPNGMLFDSRAYDALMEMFNDCKAAGLQPLICSAYRTIETQTVLFERKINKYMDQGYSYDEAYKIASTIVAIPGTSEHNLGLAVDICAAYYQVLDEAQENTPEQQWLMEHCHEYGFILRYPTDKTELTGIIYEPWHYRYVGVEAATEIMSSGICFEEYYELHFGDN